MPSKHIDFNIDAAQGFGIYKNNIETDLLDYVSTVNISCGFHARDPLTIKEALLQAKEKNIVVTFNKHKVQISQIITEVMKFTEVKDVQIRETDLADIVKEIYNNGVKEWVYEKVF